MSILAEPRRKQRISVDPQNIQWRDDDNKLSKKMMEKMGWSDGKGLGRNNHGNVDAVKLKANHSGKGLGADKLASYDSTWIGHHDDFADLLASLNKNKPKTDETEEEKKERVDKISIELSSKSVRRRIHYQKFTRMKDTANYTEQDKASVLGVGLKRTKEESSDEDSTVVKSEPENVSVDQGNTTVSTLSVGDYFAAKMAALKAKSQLCAVAVKEEITVKTEIEEEEFISENLSYDIEVKKEEIEESEKERKKREKKLRKQQQMENEKLAEEEPEEEDEETRKKRRKEEKRQMKLLKKQQEEEDVTVKEEPKEERVAEELAEKQRRKMEKRLRKMQEAAAAEEEENVPKKKKKQSDN